MGGLLPENMGINIPAPNFPVIDMPTHHMWSDEQFEILKKYITDFEDKLDDEHEVGLWLTNFGQSVTMQVREITYEYSVLMVFKGIVNGKEATLIQHINQLNFLLTSMEKEPDKPKHRIGFCVENDPETD